MSELLVGTSPVRDGALQQGLTKISRTGRDLTFPDILKSRLERETGITFSVHTVERLRERNIQLSANELERLTGAVNRAKEKGSKDSLVLIDDRAFIVSVTNRTVVTAITEDRLRDNVFTNIDSTVIA